VLDWHKNYLEDWWNSRGIIENQSKTGNRTDTQTRKLIKKQ